MVFAAVKTSARRDRSAAVTLASTALWDQNMDARRAQFADMVMRGRVRAPPNRAGAACDDEWEAHSSVDHAPRAAMAASMRLGSVGACSIVLR